MFNSGWCAHAMCMTAFSASGLQLETVFRLSNVAVMFNSGWCTHAMCMTAFLASGLQLDTVFRILKL